MRFKKYLIKNSSIQIFRSLQIKLVEKKTNHIQVVDFIEKNYNLSGQIKVLLNKSNCQLKNMYKGKYKFDLCLDEGILPDNIIRIDNKKIKLIKKEWYKVNSDLAKIQNQFENYLQQRANNNEKI